MHPILSYTKYRETFHVARFRSFSLLVLLLLPVDVHLIRENRTSVVRHSMLYFNFRSIFFYRRMMCCFHSFQPLNLIHGYSCGCNWLYLEFHFVYSNVLYELFFFCIFLIRRIHHVYGGSIYIVLFELSGKKNHCSPAFPFDKFITTKTTLNAARIKMINWLITFWRCLSVCFWLVNYLSDGALLITRVYEQKKNK